MSSPCYVAMKLSLVMMHGRRSLQGAWGFPQWNMSTPESKWNMPCNVTTSIRAAKVVMQSRCSDIMGLARLRDSHANIYIYYLPCIHMFSFQQSAWRVGHGEPWRAPPASLTVELACFCPCFMDHGWTLQPGLDVSVVSLSLLQT